MDEDETLVEIEGGLVGLVGLKSLFAEYADRDLSDARAIKSELLSHVEKGNHVPPGKREVYADTIFRELGRYLERREAGGRSEATRMTWRGIARESIQWFPMVDEDHCDGCKKCITFCSFGVFTFSRKEGTIKVTNRYACVVGCSLCSSVCPPGAISFPPLSYLDDLTRSRGGGG